MRDRIQGLTRLAQDVQRRGTIEELLQAVVEHTVGLLHATHASVRLLNPARTHLVAVCRSGEPIHLEPVEFRNGEGLLGWITEHQTPIRSADPMADPRFVAKPGSTAFGTFLGVPLLANNTCLGVISAIDDTRAFTSDDQDLLTLVAAICSPHLEIARLARLSQVDPLTGTLNRRGLAESFPAEPEGVDTSTTAPMSVIMIDIDLFKSINDSHGHAVGDEVLRHVSRLLSTVLRSSDAIVRWGGEEFVLLLPGVRMATALRIAERARAAVQAHPTQVGKGIAATVSAGVAQQRPHETLEHLIDRAGSALYSAKQSGRNRVESAEPDERNE